MPFSEDTQTFLQRLSEKGYKPEGVLDVGAYEGEFSILARSYFPSSKIIMVEPLNETRETLDATMQSLGGIELHNVALGSEEKYVDFFVVDREEHPEANLTGSSKYIENSNYKFVKRTVPQTTLECVLDKTQIEAKFQFMKIDVQGAEIEVIKSAGKYLDDIEFIFMEMSVLNYNKGAPTFGTMMYEMEKLGFVPLDFLGFFRTGGTGHLIHTDVLFCRPDCPYRMQPPYIF